MKGTESADLSTRTSLPIAPQPPNRAASPSASTRTSYNLPRGKPPRPESSKVQDESKCYICDTSFTFLGSRRKVCHFCKQSVCDDHSRGKKDNERVCDSCSRQIAKRELKASDENDQIAKLRLRIELEMKAREERRLESQRKEAEIARLKEALSLSNAEYDSAQSDLESKIEQEIQRNAKHQQIADQLQQTLDEVKKSKQTVESKLSEVHSQFDFAKAKSNLIDSQKREVEAAIAEKTAAMKNSLPFYQLRTVICRSCKKYLRHNTHESLFKHVSAENLKSFIGVDSTASSPGATPSGKCCNCEVM